MLIDQEKCIGCGLCTYYCPIDAITTNNGKAEINLELCTECCNCLRANVCKPRALFQQPLDGARVIRSLLSDVQTVYKGINGRGTEEMKTNDVTGRIKSGFCGVAIELGRPGVSTTVRDVEKVAKVVAAHGGIFEEYNPISNYIVNKQTGEMDKEVLDERILSGIIEVTVDSNRLIELIKAVIEVSSKLDTVFSLSVSCRVEKDGTIPAQILLEQAGIYYRPNGKTNVGLGRPRYE